MSPEAQKFVSLVIPFSGDLSRDAVGECVTRLDQRYRNFEVLIVDNGEYPGGRLFFDSVKDSCHNIRWLHLGNCGSTEYAGLAALQYALGDIVAVADLARDSLHDILAIIQDCESSGVTTVAAHVPRQRLQKCFMNLSYWISSQVFKVRFLRFVTGLVALRRTDVTQINRYNLSNLSLKYDIPRLGVTWRYYHQKEVCLERSRIFARVESNLRALIVNSSRPLRFASTLAILLFFVNLLYLGYIGLIVLFRSTVVEGWVTTNVIITANFAALSLAAAIGFEYLLRILQENKKRFDHTKLSEAKSYSMIKDEAGRRNVVSLDSRPL